MPLEASPCRNPRLNDAERIPPPDKASPISLDTGGTVGGGVGQSADDEDGAVMAHATGDEGIGGSEQELSPGCSPHCRAERGANTSPVAARPMEHPENPTAAERPTVLPASLGLAIGLMIGLPDAAGVAIGWLPVRSNRWPGLAGPHRAETL